MPVESGPVSVSEEVLVEVSTGLSFVSSEVPLLAISPLAPAGKI